MCVLGCWLQTLKARGGGVGGGGKQPCPIIVERTKTASQSWWLEMPSQKTKIYYYLIITTYYYLFITTYYYLVITTYFFIKRC